MTSKQYETYYQTLDPNNAIRKLHHELGFLLFDTDRNDEIDFVEFLMANAFATSKTRHEALSYVFDMCDYTQDGRMDMNELVRFSSVAVASAKSTLHTSTLKTMGLAADIIRFIGLKAEKKLTKEEFIADCEKNLILSKLFEVKS
ncbi:unnamed protein product [Rotaria sordida]|uniref:Calmodulin n=1 Tax=Rotaria sordida TaxID=392033 RepID=A0A814D9F7_9BILA|nr:unnamed protein product [Rotaria sordida]